MCINRCKTCNNVRWEYIKDNKYDLLCNLGKRFVSRDVTVLTTIMQPDWCPLKKRENAWADLKPQVEWSTIKVGDKFHVPPHRTEKRFDIEIVGVCSNNWVSYNRKGSTIINFLYPNDIISKVMVRKKE